MYPFLDASTFMNERKGLVAGDCHFLYALLLFAWPPNSRGLSVGLPSPTRLPITRASLCVLIIQVQHAAGGVAKFHFEELCARPLGSADYLALAHAFHTIFLLEIPAMNMQACLSCVTQILPL